MRALVVCLLACGPALAQFSRYSLGITAGVPLKAPARAFGYGSDESRRYSAGVVFEAALNESLSLAVNPLYRRTGSSVDGFPAAGQIYLVSSRTRSNVLEVPVIGKYTFSSPARRWRPFLGAGFALRHGRQDFVTEYAAPSPTGGEPERRRAESRGAGFGDAGAVAAAGIHWKWRALTLAPEVRFTHWGGGNGAHRRNQADALFSIRF